MSEEIAVLGPPGTFSSIAAKRMHPEGKYLYKSCVGDVFGEVEYADCLGVVALENSLEGSVGETITHLMKDDVYIIKDYVMPVTFGLAVNKGTGINGIREVASHPHALAQCSRYLDEKLPDAGRRGVNSTVEALEYARENEGVAALAFPESIKEHGLSLLEDEVQEDYSETRFITVSKQPASGDQTSIMLALNDRPGALHEILGVFAGKGINLTKIESRPARTQIGDYVFFIDYENEGVDVGEVFRMVSPYTTLTKDLGSYQRQ